MNSIEKVAIVTGAGTGIGRQTALALLKENYAVALAGRRVERLEETAAKAEPSGSRTLVAPTDLSDPASVRALFAKTKEAFGRLDVLFNNAGLARLTWLEELDPIKDIQLQLQVNLSGAIQMSRAVLPHMILRGSGHIINTGSIAGLVGTPTYSVYAASKFGLRGFTEALRREVGIHGINVSGIYPGGVANEFGQKAGIQRKTGLSTPKFLKLTSDDVAKETMRVANRPKRMVVIPRVMWLGYWFNILFPGLLDWIVEWRFTRRERPADK